MFLPRDTYLHDRFKRFAALLIEAATHLEGSLKTGAASFADTAKTLREYEAKADTVGMEMFTYLDKSFMAPYDPEDILSLVHYLDDVMDGLEDVAHRLHAFRVTSLHPQMLRLGTLMVEAAVELEKAMQALADKKDVITHCLALGKYESEADDLTRTGIADLFANEKDAIALIKAKEIYEYFERTADSYKHVATILGRIQVKGG